MITQTTADNKIDKKGVGSDKEVLFKIWKSTMESDAGMMVTPDTAYVIGNKNNFVGVSNTGVAVNANGFSLNCLSENQRTGGMFIKMNDFMRMIPQTIVTPIPSQIPFPPIALPLEMLKGLPFFLAMLI